MKKLWYKVAEWAARNNMRNLVVWLIMLGIFLGLIFVADTLLHFFPDGFWSEWGVGLIIAVIFGGLLGYYRSRVETKVILMLVLPLGVMSQITVGDAYN